MPWNTYDDDLEAAAQEYCAATEEQDEDEQDIEDRRADRLIDEARDEVIYDS